MPENFFQYLMIALIFFFAVAYIFNVLRKNLGISKKKNPSGCDKNCGCS